MASLPDIYEMQCPRCDTAHWEIDSQFRGMDGQRLRFGERAYRCPHCGHDADGYRVLRNLPLIVGGSDPIPEETLDLLVEVVRANFPKHLDSTIEQIREHRACVARADVQRSLGLTDRPKKVAQSSLMSRLLARVFKQSRRF